MLSAGIHQLNLQSHMMMIRFFVWLVAFALVTNLHFLYEDAFFLVCRHESERKNALGYKIFLIFEWQSGWRAARCVADPELFFTPGSGISFIRIPDPQSIGISESLVTIFWEKILKFFVRSRILNRYFWELVTIFWVKKYFYSLSLSSNYFWPCLKIKWF